MWAPMSTKVHANRHGHSNTVGLTWVFEILAKNNFWCHPSPCPHILLPLLDDHAFDQLWAGNVHKMKNEKINNLKNILYTIRACKHVLICMIDDSCVPVRIRKHNAQSKINRSVEHESTKCMMSKTAPFIHTPRATCICQVHADTTATTRAYTLQLQLPPANVSVGVGNNSNDNACNQLTNSRVHTPLAVTTSASLDLWSLLPLCHRHRHRRIAQKACSGDKDHDFRTEQ